MAKKNKPKCPKCNSTRITFFIDEDKKGFKCPKCDYIWAQLRLIKKE